MLSDTAVTTFIFISALLVQTSSMLTMDSAIRYLAKYNFLKNQTEITDYRSKEVREAFKSFQKFTGLKITGRLDEATKQKISEEQQSDVYDLNLNDGNMMHKWEKKNLTYSIGSIPKQLSRKVVRTALKIAFEAWSAVAPLNFTEVPSNGDIKIDFVSGKHADAYAFDGKGKVLAHALLPPYGLIHFDADENWAFMHTDDLSRYDTIDLLPTAIHEIGHVLGLEHSREKESVMSPFYHQPINADGKYVSPKLTGFDILRIQELYGAKKTRPKFSKADFRVIVSTAAPPEYWAHLSGKRYGKKKKD